MNTTQQTRLVSEGTSKTLTRKPARRARTNGPVGASRLRHDSRKAKGPARGGPKAKGRYTSREARVLPKHPAPEAALKPIYRCTGGKGRILADILDHVPAGFGHYYEPYLGGGAVFFGLMPERFTISDSEPRLIEAYQGVAADPEGVIKLMLQYTEEAAEGPEDYYYGTRWEMNTEWDSMSPARKAATYMYINHNCFNGVWRTNKKGENNVPWNKRPPAGVNEQAIRDAADLLSKGELLCGDGAKAISRARKGDLVYCDPPRTGDFSDEDHERLAAQCQRLADRGVAVMVSTKNTGQMRELYKGFRENRLRSPLRVNSKGDQRGEVMELLLSANCP